jgi:hypothetical protein
MSNEFKRMIELAGLPITETTTEENTTETLNENFVGIPAINNVFEREKTDYELAFEHFTKGTSLNEVEEDLQQTDVKSAIDGKQLDLDKLKDATEKAMKGDSTDLTLFLAGVFESKGLEENIFQGEDVMPKFRAGALKQLIAYAEKEGLSKESIDDLKAALAKIEAKIEAEKNKKPLPR